MEAASQLEPEMVSDPGAIRELADVARAEGQLSLDTEFLWERTYAPILCLLQVATRERIALIDPIAGSPVDAIAELVADPAVEIVMHAPASDALLFALRFDALATNVFDTQTAAGFVGLGAGLGYDRLVESALVVRLEHDATFSDWSRRPLSATQLAYAADDVRYLLPLADELRRRLRDLGREAWATDELQRRFGDPEGIISDPERAYLRVARRGRLSPRQLAVLRELAAWREREARRRDLPPGWVVKDPSLVELARAQPRQAEGLARVRGLGNLRRGDADGVLAAIKRGAEGEPIRQPREPAGDVARRAGVNAALAALLVRARCDEAGLAPELVATRAELEEFARRAASGSADGHPLQSGWRGELLGTDLLDLLAGRIAIAASDRPPHVVTVPLP